MAKKWYSYFVVTDDPEVQASAAEVTTEKAPAPKVAADLAGEGTPAPVPEAVVSDPDLETVYRSARIEVPPHGYTVFKVADMLRSEHLQALPTDVKRRSILVALEGAGVSVDDIVRDAVRRDQALDTYERVLEKHHEDVANRIATENQQLESEIAQRVAELRARIDENNKAVAADQAELQAWRARKQQHERAIADAVAYFVTENPVSVAPSPGPAPQGESDVR